MGREELLRLQSVLEEAMVEERRRIQEVAAKSPRRPEQRPPLSPQQRSPDLQQKMSQFSHQWGAASLNTSTVSQAGMLPSGIAPFIDNATAAKLEYARSRKAEKSRSAKLESTLSQVLYMQDSERREFQSLRERAQRLEAQLEESQQMNMELARQQLAVSTELSEVRDALHRVRAPLLDQIASLERQLAAERESKSSQARTADEAAAVLQAKIADLHRRLEQERSSIQQSETKARDLEYLLARSVPEDFSRQLQELRMLVMDLSPKLSQVFTARDLLLKAAQSSGSESAHGEYYFQTYSGLIVQLSELERLLAAAHTTESASLRAQLACLQRKVTEEDALQLSCCWSQPYQATSQQSQQLNLRQHQPPCLDAATCEGIDAGLPRSSLRTSQSFKVYVHSPQKEVTFIPTPLASPRHSQEKSSHDSNADAESEDLQLPVSSCNSEVWIDERHSIGAQPTMISDPFDMGRRAIIAQRATMSRTYDDLDWDVLSTEVA